MMNTQSNTPEAPSQSSGSAVPHLSNLLDINTTAKILGISPKTLRDHVLRRRIDFVKIGGRVLFRQDTIWELIDRSTVRALVQ